MKTVVFRPTNSCNLRCTYCYDKNNHPTDLSAVRKNATELFKKEEDNILRSLGILYAGERAPHILFHGGEPLLISSDVLDEFCRKLREENNVTFGIQTNGTLINSEVIDLFKKYDFQIGLSLDGCNEQQNHARVYPNGTNSYETVMKGIKKLQDNYARFGLVISITKAHQDSEQQLYDFIAENGVSCNIRPVFASDPTEISDVMTEEEYATFFNKLFDIWYDDPWKRVRPHQVTELYKALKRELDPFYRDKGCSNSNKCFRYFVSMDVFSNLYACNRLYGVNKFYYGNLKTDSIDTIYGKIETLLDERNKAIAASCSSCETLSECYGGCPAEAYDMYGDISQPTTNCKVKRLIAQHVRQRLDV